MSSWRPTVYTSKYDIFAHFDRYDAGILYGLCSPLYVLP